MTRDYSNDTLPALAVQIRADWSTRGKGVNYAAAPYLAAMRELPNIDTHYGHDPGREIVLRFLGNAGSWRGDTARAIKAELRKRLES